MRGFLIEEDDRGFRAGVVEVEPSPVDAGDVLVDVEYSGVNFKDAMVASPASRVRRAARLVGGVDAAGVVTASGDPALPVGSRVVAYGGALGVSRDGGFAESLYAPARYVTPLPGSLSTREAMVVGTAGVTAVASVLALEDRGLAPGASVLVTGATGGVGSMAVALLAARGYVVTASTGSSEHAAWLSRLGAASVIGRDEVADHPGRPLAAERWDGAVDCVGGATLAEVLRALRYGAAVAASGLVAGPDLATTVYPFILRGVALLGVDSVEMGPPERERVWSTVADVAPRLDLEAILEREATLEELPDALAAIAQGATRGRVVVTPAPR